MKKIIKTAFFTLFACLMLPIVALFYLLALGGDKDELLASFSQGLSLIPGKIGCYLRSAFYRFTLTHCAPNALVGFNTLLSQTDCTIEQGVYVGPQGNIGSCRIGANTLLGSGVHVMSGKGQHNFERNDVPIKDQGGRLTKVDIGSNCWVGNGALIMADIGAGSVIAAGSVVVDAIPANAIAVGNPAKVIKFRGE